MRGFLLGRFEISSECLVLMQLGHHQAAKLVAGVDVGLPVRPANDPALAEFATALRAVGEPMRGLPVKDMSIGMMLDGLFSITRDFDMVTQPHLLLLQKTMVMEEGVATALDPDINMWEAAEPFLKDWLRTELGPEAYYADRIVDTVRAFKAAQSTSKDNRPSQFLLDLLSKERVGVAPVPLSSVVSAA